MFADTHCHLDFDEFSSRLGAFIADLDQSSLGMVVVPSVSVSNWDDVISLCRQNERLFYALGLHPYFIEQHQLTDLKLLESKIYSERLIEEEGFVALGEMGLDASRPNIAKQVELFDMQLALAQKLKLPVIIHVRKLHGQVVSILKRYSLVGGVVHAFSGSYELLKNYVDLGFKIGVGPVITWSTSHKTRAAIMKAPLDNLVLETDSPDMFVEGVDRGQSSPHDVVKVLDVLSEIRTESKSLLMTQLWKNSQNLFNRDIRCIKNINKTSN